MGNWHDWFTLTQTAAKRLGEINQSPLVAVLHNVTGGKFRHAVAALTANGNVSIGKPMAPVSSEIGHEGSDSRWQD